MAILKKKENAQTFSHVGTKATRIPRLPTAPSTSTNEANEPVGNAKQSDGQLDGSWGSDGSNGCGAKPKPRRKDEPKRAGIEVASPRSPARRFYIWGRI